MERAGASVTMLPGGEIYQALEKGAIDATEFSLPIVDQSLGFDRVAKFNLFPGWHQPFTSTHMVVNLERWHSLSRSQQVLLETACMAATARNLADSEGNQGAVIAGFADKGVTASYLPMPVLRRLREITRQVLDEEAAANPQFAAILQSQRDFASEYAHWKQLGYLPRDFE